jgi:hypothetical protein
MNTSLLNHYYKEILTHLLTKLNIPYWVIHFWKYTVQIPCRKI